MRIPFIVALFFASSIVAPMELEAQEIAYPKTHKGDHVDVYHGVEVADPYRWLEDPDSPESRQWIEAQNRVTRSVLDAIPEREALEERLSQLWNYPKRGPSDIVGDSRVFSHNDGLQNQSVIYRQRAGEEPEVLLDPNTLSADGTVALAGLEFSDDGALLAYSISRGGSDWQEWRVRDAASGIDLDEVLKWSKFSGASWAPDRSGFFYCRYPAPAEGDELEAVNEHMKVYFHAVGTSQDNDRLVYELPAFPRRGFAPTVTEDGRYLVITVWEGTDRRNLVHYRPLKPADAPVVELISDLVADYQFLGNEEETFYFLTGDDAPQARVIAIDVTRPEREHWREVIAERSEKLESASIHAGRLVLTYLADASHRVRIHGLDGRFQRELPLPGIGSVSGFTGKASASSASFSFSSFLSPPTIYRYHFDEERLDVEFQAELDFDFSAYETRRMFARSKDGTAVPFFLVGKRGLERTGDHPTLVYGYGGFNIAMTPGFSPANLVWLEQGGLYVMAVLRGGSEYGEAWHEAGMLHEKQNVFDDFQAVAQYLVDEQYTAPAHLGIHGGSNGGLLVGTCVNQRPDLYACAIPAVGVMDMLRFQEFTIGWAWVPEYGSSADPAQFETLHAYSPLHNLRDGTHYPAVMVTTGDHDDRVVPAHSFKYAARLQEAQSGSRPTLIRIETRAGHGGGKPTAMQIEEWGDKLAFLLDQTRRRDRQ